MTTNNKRQQTIGDALKWGIAVLRGHNCAANDAEREARDLLAFAIKCDETHVIAAANEPIDDDSAERYRRLISQRLGHHPLAYLLGTAWFMGREFNVTSDTLIPRPATEHIVEAALEIGNAISAKNYVDVGTGTGAIAISLSLAKTGAKIFAVDLSASAIAVAKENAELTKADITYFIGDILTPLPENIFGEPTVIVANLPYIPEPDWETLSPDIREHEPKSALTAGIDGLDDYRELIEQLHGKTNARPIGLVMEILPKQFGELKKIILEAWPDMNVNPITNLAGCVIGVKVS